MRRFDFKILGKKELYVPYNSNKTAFVTRKELFSGHHLNPDHVRWELHRVWMVESTLRAVCPRGVDLRFSREIDLLGTAGGLRKARTLFDNPQSPVIVMNGDTLFAPDLGCAYAAHIGRGAVATMILRPTSEP